MKSHLKYFYKAAMSPLLEQKSNLLPEQLIDEFGLEVFLPAVDQKPTAKVRSAWQDFQQNKNELTWQHFIATCSEAIEMDSQIKITDLSRKIAQTKVSNQLIQNELFSPDEPKLQSIHERLLLSVLAWRQAPLIKRLLPHRLGSDSNVQHSAEVWGVYLRQLPRRKAKKIVFKTIHDFFCIPTLFAHTPVKEIKQALLYVWVVFDIKDQLPLLWLMERAYKEHFLPPNYSMTNIFFRSELREDTVFFCANQTTIPELKKNVQDYIDTFFETNKVVWNLLYLYRFFIFLKEIPITNPIWQTYLIRNLLEQLEIVCPPSTPVDSFHKEILCQKLALYYQKNKWQRLLIEFFPRKII